MWIAIGEILFFVVVGVLLLGGLILVIVNLPGAWVIWVAILLTAIVKGLTEIPLWFVIVTFVIAIIISLIDNLIIPIAAKKFGGGKWGMLGGILGAFLGFIILNLPGLFIGPFLGAFILEYLVAKKKSGDAFKAGFGSLVGVVLSIALKVVFCISMIVAFITIWVA